MPSAQRPKPKAPKTIDITFLDRISPSQTAVPNENIRALWAESVAKGSWARAAFFLQELKEKGTETGATLALIRAVNLYQSGARSESISELESARGLLRDPEKQAVNEILYSQYLNSSAPEKAVAIGEEIAAAKLAREKERKPAGEKSP